MKDESKTRQQLLDELLSLRDQIERQEDARKELGGMKASVSRLARLYRALSRINETIVSVREPDRLHKEICRIMVEDAGFVMSWIGITDPKTLKLPATAYWGREDGYLKNISISVNGNIPEGKGPTGTAARESRPFICNDIQNDPKMEPWRKDALKRGYLSSAAFPITNGVKTIGVLNVYAGEPGFFNDEEVSLLKAFTSNIFYAIEAAEHTALMKRVERELQRERDFVSGIIENVGALLLVLDLDGKIVSFNNTCEKITGYSFNEVRDQHFWDLFIIPEEQELIGREFRKLTSGDLPSSLTNYWLTRSGDKRLISWRNTYLSDSDGNVQYIIASGVDITEQKKTEDTLRNAADEWKRTFDSIPDLILLIDKNHEITRVNKATVNVLALPEERIIGRKCYSLIYPSDCPHSFCPHALTMRDGKEHSEEVHEPTLGRDFKVTTTPVHDDSGTIIGSVHLMRDITDQKRFEGTLRAALDERKERGAETEALLKASRAVLENHKFEDAAKTIFQVCKDLIGAQAGYIALLSDDHSENEVAYLDVGNTVCTVPSDIPMPIRGFRALAYKSTRAIFENKFNTSKWTQYLPEGHAPLNNVLFAPLIIDGQHVGLLGLGNKPDGFNENDARMATAAAEFAAIALKNSRTLEALASSEEKFRSVAQTATDALVTVDDKGKIIFWNGGAETIFGYKSEEAIGKQVTMLIPEKAREAHVNGMARLARTGVSRIVGKTTELRGLHKNGHEFPLELSLASWRTTEGDFYTAIIRDITKRKQVEETLRRHQEHLETLVQERTDALLKKERKYRNLFENAHVGMALTRRDNGEIIDANNKYAQILGFARSEMIGRPATTLYVDPSERGHLLEMLDKQKSFSEYEMRLYTKTGEIKSVLVSSHISEESDEIIEGAIVDITEKRRAEEQRRKAEEKYRKLFENVQVGLFITKVDGSGFLDVNDRYAEILGYRRDELVGKPGTIQWYDLGERQRIVNELLKNKVAPRMEITLKKKNGDPVFVETWVRISEESDDIIEGSMIDITDRKRAEEARREAELRIEEQRAKAIHSDRLRSLGEMAAGIAHELNQPLLGVRGLAEHIVIGMDRGWKMTPEKMRDKINLIIAQSDRMTHIIEHVRIFAREAGSIETMPVNVNEVVNSCIGMIGSQMNARGFILECDLADNLPAVKANPFSLEEVIFNLITNARDALAERDTGDSPNALRISLRTFVDGDDGKNVIIQVCDKGIGIPEDVLPSVFDPFFTTKASSKGTGLGLPIARSIIESFSGKIDIESEVGKGTTITISLPPMGE